MVYRIVSASLMGEGQQVFLPNTGDAAYVMPGVLVVSFNDFALASDAPDIRLIVDGTISAGGAAAVRMGQNALFDMQQSVFVGAAGIVRAMTTAIWITGPNSQIRNHGEIGGGDVGISLSGQGSLTTTRITNHGVIAGEVGIRRELASDTETIRVYNLGTLEGETTAYNGLSCVAADRIVNRGLIMGDLRLGGGDDHFDGRGDGQVNGIIYGGANNDTFVPGLGDETIWGDGGTDTVDGSASSLGLTLALDGSVAGVGRTADDSYRSIEVVIGSRLGADLLFGAAAAETLTGLGGADVLEGRAGRDRLQGDGGNDRLAGEGGIDTLTGGTGDDRFVFRTFAEAGDVITDFAGAVGNNDAIEVAVAGFGAGLIRGTLATASLQIRADNVAQDADDRFVFRTTDQTLWFDGNGNRVGGLRLLADLQAGAAVTAGDILLV